MAKSLCSSYPSCQPLPGQNGFVLESPAKINLGLRILGHRPDGYHDIETIFQEISLADRLEFRPSDDWQLTSSQKGLDCGESNLVVRAARRLAGETGHPMRGALHLVKQIPIGGGLGGGSSNGAVALLGLCQLWNLDVQFSVPEQIAADIGADCPFFLRGGLAFATGRGDRVEWLSGAIPGVVLLVMPGFSVNTGWAYEKAAGVLTNREKNSMLKDCIENPNPLKALRERAANDLEAGVFAQFPELERIKVDLQRAGAELAALSGSGATVLGIFQDRSRAERAAQLFRDRYKTFIGSPVARERPKPGCVGSAGRV